MKILPISASYSNNQHQSKVKQNSVVKNSLPLQNTISAVYPKNYYLSFKGEEKCDEIKAFEKLIDKFYKENEGQPAEYKKLPKYGTPESSTISRFINNRFPDEMNKLIKYKPRAYVSEKDLIDILDKSIKQTKERMSHVDIPEHQLEKLDITAQKIIDELKQENKIPTITRSEIKGKEVRNFNAQIFNYIESIDLGDEDTNEVNSSFFIDYYFDNLKKYDIPRVDKELYDAMKDFLLNDKAFKTFNQKMLKIEAQNAINSSPSLAEAAESIYNDITENHINPFDNPKMYDYVTKHDESLDYLLEQIYGYGKTEYDDMFKDSGMDNKQKVLLIDPALASRFEEFVDFVKKEEINTSDIEPFELRKKFSDYLGTETIYRGIYFDNPQDGIENLKKHGAFSSVFKDREKALASIKYYLSPEVKEFETVRGEMSQKIQNPQRGNDFLSVTSEYDIAAAVPKRFDKPQCPVVVIKKELPKLSMIKQQGRFANIQHGPARVLNVNDKKYPYESQQDKIEAFVPFYMSTDNAKFITDTTTDGFYWSDI